MKRMCLLPALLITLVGVSLPILPRALAELTRQNELSRQETDPGPPNQAKVYPPYGTTPQDGHYAFATKEGGIAIWGSEVLDFFKAASR